MLLLLYLFSSYHSVLLIIAPNVVVLIEWSRGSLRAISLVRSINTMQLALCILSPGALILDKLSPLDSHVSHYQP